jgi:hypothetical protein
LYERTATALSAVPCPVTIWRRPDFILLGEICAKGGEVMLRRASRSRDVFKVPEPVLVKLVRHQLKASPENLKDLLEGGVTQI